MTEAGPPRITLVGAGLMGSGLARLFRGLGWTVTAYDRNQAALASLLDAVSGVVAAANLAEAAGSCDFVIEAASESLSVKRAIFSELAAAASPAVILTTNSSVIQVGEITAELTDAQAARCVGAHFWNPPDLIPLVEVIQSPRTSTSTVEAMLDMLRRAGKEPVAVLKDVVPGNRMQHALWREAMALVDEGVCSPADIDTIVKRGFGLRLPVLGPLENADLVSLALTRQIHEVVLPTLSRSSTPSRGLIDRLDAGAGGVTDGAGYLQWTPDRVAATRTKVAAHLYRMLGRVRP